MSKIEVKYLNHMGDDLSVVNSARVSFGKISTQLDQKDSKLINYLAKHKHLTPFEHCSLTILIKCPLFIRSQIHRHRTFSYNEISRRYTSENIEFFIPSTIREQHSSSKQCSGGSFDILESLNVKQDMEDHHNASLKLYNNLIDKGVARETARGILPQNLMTEFWMTGNLRNWIHFLGLRIDEHAQEEVRDVAQPILEIIKDKFPESSKALFKHMLGIEMPDKKEDKK